jgi:hypothetical protein
MVDPPKCEQLSNRLPAQMPKRSGGHLFVAMTSIAQLICALWELLIGRESGRQPSVALLPASSDSLCLPRGLHPVRHSTIGSDGLWNAPRPA